MAEPPAFRPGALHGSDGSDAPPPPLNRTKCGKERTGYGCFTVSPDWKARAKNTACAVFLAGPPVTAALQPSGLELGFLSCGPNLSRSGVEPPSWPSFLRSISEKLFYIRPGG